MSKIPTRVLLICAAVAAVTGIISGLAGIASFPVIAVVPVLYGVVLTAHALPGIMAQVLLRQKWVAVITHLIAGFIVFAMNPTHAGVVLLAIAIMAGIQEGWAAIGRYKRWGAGWLLTGSATLGLVLGLIAGLPIGLKYLPWWGTIISVALTVIASCVWTMLSIAVANALHRAGLTRTFRA